MIRRWFLSWLIGWASRSLRSVQSWPGPRWPAGEIRGLSWALQSFHHSALQHTNSTLHATLFQPWPGCYPHYVLSLRPPVSESAYRERESSERAAASLSTDNRRRSPSDLQISLLPTFVATAFRAHPGLDCRKPSDTLPEASIVPLILPSVSQTLVLSF